MLADTLDLLWDMTYSHNRYRKAQLAFLFSVGISIIAVTSVRLAKTLLNPTSQVDRMSLASAELLVAAFVANAPVLYSFWRLFRKKFSSLSGRQQEET
jgi:uncharacterized membrane-anchored protein YitT (DUF2179 family)